MIDFAIIGAQKSGTTSLAFQLALHPDICFSSNKEPGYFNLPDGERGPVSEYHALFSPRPGQICGEASTMYTFLPEWTGTHRRLWNYNPKLKFIYIMRDPVERIVSQYAFRVLHDRVDEPPDSAVLTDPTYLNRSRYAVQLRPYLETFGRDRLLLLVFEEYTRNPRAGLKEVARFLGIPEEPFDTIDVTPRHVTTQQELLKDWARVLRNSLLGKAVRPFMPESAVAQLRQTFSRTVPSKPEITRETREMLWRFLEDDVAEVEALLGRSIPQWGSRAKKPTAPLRLADQLV